MTEKDLAELEKQLQTGKNQKKKKKAKKKPQDIARERLQTKIVDDVFVDAVESLKPKFDFDYNVYLDKLWESNPDVYRILREADDLETAREELFTYLEYSVRDIFELNNDLHILEKNAVRDSVRVFKSIIGQINEKRTDFSALDCLWKLANERQDEIEVDLQPGFLMEFIHLFLSVAGKSNIYYETREARKGIPDFLKLHGRDAANARTEMLDNLGSTIQKYFKKYPSGLEEDVKNWREENRKNILKYFDATEEDWNNYEWQIKNVIKNHEHLIALIELSADEKRAIKKAWKNHIPFGITPYYLSLIDQQMSLGYDHAVRAQVLPPPDYVDKMSRHKSNRGYVFDFMGEHDTSPVELVTRRYPGIAILKPFNTCAQICVYCQRNWEIDQVLDPGAMADSDSLRKALKWFDNHKSVGDVLITGGDPMIMPDEKLELILSELSKRDHIYRIRIGTRTPVVLPQRYTENLLNILDEYHEPGKREIAIITHFEHPYEITPEAMQAVQKIRKLGMGVYNQVVFTVENSRRFELARLRRDLRLIGVDPYYSFNMKGKEETREYMVPIARILQERKEEARLLPGLDRTDEPVFNVPKLGKNHLRAWQDHKIVMILPDGNRVYEFHPWEKNITPVPPYNYVDVPIYNYLEELASRGENIMDYRTIWYYY